MNLKIVLSAVLINCGLAIWPIIAKRSGMVGSTVTFLYFIGNIFAVAIIWLYSQRAGALDIKWVAIILGLGITSGCCMSFYTSILMNPKIQTGLFMVLSALLYAFFSPLFDWLINGAKLSSTQRFGILLAVAAVYCLAGKK